MMNAIEVRDVHKIYRRYGRRKQFATMKSALLSGSLLRDLRPDETFEALRGVTFDVRHLSNLRKGFKKACSQARKAGLIGKK